ncbi:MAG: LPS export ABC transporter periplasmic protein LptC [candidate division KSB1 bacterium]|nr:LPS export ABC transporter periplasmic protein LptC [candidate division KSB1 bacterium]
MNNSPKFCIIFVAMLVAFGCGTRESQLTSQQNVNEIPDQEGWNSTVTTSKNGKDAAVIIYVHMQRFKERQLVELDGKVMVDFFNEQGMHTSNLVADRGRLDETTNNIEAFGNVVVVSDTGITLKTERLRWDNSIEKIVSNDFVTIITADQDTFYGKGFESDQNLENWRIIAFSGKTSRALDLNLQPERRKSKKEE